MKYYGIRRGGEWEGWWLQYLPVNRKKYGWAMVISALDGASNYWKK